MIIIQIRGQESLEMTFVEDDDVIQKFSAKATDQAFIIGVCQGEAGAGAVTTSSIPRDSSFRRTRSP
jgi:hypothetical protein